MLTQLLVKHEQRQLKILRSLIDNAKERTIDEFCFSNNCTEQTVLTDLESLSQRFPDFEYTIKENLIFLTHVNMQHLEGIYYAIILESDIKKILDALILEKYHQAKDLAELLDTSPATLSRTLNKLNSILEDSFSISLKRAPLSFEGSETKIRNFIRLYFQEIISISFEGLIFLDHFHDSYAFTYHSIKDLANEIENNSYNFMSLTPTFTLFLTNVLRHKQGHNIEVTMAEKIPKSLINRLISNASKHLSMEITEDDLTNIFFPFLNKNVSYSISECVYINEKVNETTCYIIDTIEEQSPIPLDNHYTQYLLIFNFLNQLGIERKYTSILFPQQMLIQYYYKKHYYNFYQLISEIVHSAPHIHNAEQESLIKYLLFTSWTNLYKELQKYYAQINAIIIPNYSYYQALYVKNILEMELSKGLNIDIYSDSPILLENQSFEDYDIVLNQVPYFKNDHPHIIDFGTFFTDHDYLNILYMMKNIQDERTNQPIINPSEEGENE